MLYSVSCYDKRVRLIQSKLTNHLGGKEKVFVAYSFYGLQNKRFHEHTDAGNTPDPKGKYIWDFLGGVVRAIGSNLALGTMPANASYY